MITATFLALGAAVLHAAWNVRVKRSGDRFLAMWGQSAAGGVCCLAVLLVVGPPPSEAWPYLAASAVIHLGYVLALVRAYDLGDFSLAYPVARGGGAVGAAIGGWALLDDDLHGWSWVAIALVGIGLLTFAPRRASWVPIGGAAVVAVTIAAYTLVDSAGSREAGGVAYSMCTFVGLALVVSIWGVATGQTGELTAAWSTSWRSHLWAGVASATAYALVLEAVRRAPVGYVTVLRESSVLLGPLAGTALLHEPLGRSRARSALVVFGGLVLLIAVR
ncbi:MAG: EamA family transporter [Acidimicrobiales bacterium]